MVHSTLLVKLLNSIILDVSEKVHLLAENVNDSFYNTLLSLSLFVNSITSYAYAIKPT